MQITITVVRRISPSSAPYEQQILYEPKEENETVATALNRINDEDGWTDIAGEVVTPIRWECSCLQKKCGACAMVINGEPRLACDCFLNEFKKAGKVRLEPLKKFPPVADLIVDRSILSENLKLLKVWAREDISFKDKNVDTAYEASRCLQCGCCLEACPNFNPDGDFFGAAGFVPDARLIVSLPEKERKEIQKLYKDHIYKNCAKSLACQKVCPAGIDMDHMLSRSNAFSVWGRGKKK